MLRRPTKQNALKHGVYVANTILPGEDPHEFDALCAQVNNEWQPCGVTEEDAALDLVRAMWLKLRYEKYKNKRISDLVRLLSQLRPSGTDSRASKPIPLPEEATVEVDEWGAPQCLHDAEALLVELRELSTSLDGNLSKSQIDSKLENALDWISERLIALVPYENFTSIPEWATALKKEIDDGLLPFVEEIFSAMGVTTLEIHSLRTPEAILQDLAMSDRINSKIEKAIRRIVNIKAFKHMNETNQNKSMPKQIEGQQVDNKRLLGLI